jgi:hypothetical protein
MGIYSLTNLFQKEPVAIASGIRAVLFVAVLFGLAIDEKQLAAIALAAEVVLGLIARQASTPVAAPTLPLGTPVTVERPAGAPADQPPPDAVVALR